MLTGRTIRTSIVILAAAVAASTQAQAHSTSCTPAHLVSALKQVEAECGAAKIVSAHRPGARIAGTGRVSQHSFCNGTNGAIDAVFSNRACALSALRKTNYTILTYGKSAHIHIGTDGWRNGANTHVARRNTTARVRMASRQRSGTHTASRQRAGVRVAQAQWSGEQRRLGQRQLVGRKLVEWKRRGVRLSAALPRSLGFQAAHRRARRVPAGVAQPERLGRQRVERKLVVRSLGRFTKRCDESRPVRPGGFFMQQPKKARGSNATALLANPALHAPLDERPTTFFPARAHPVHWPFAHIGQAARLLLLRLRGNGRLPGERERDDCGTEMNVIERIDIPPEIWALRLPSRLEVERQRCCRISG